jgi:hypothetical protein
MNGSPARTLVAAAASLAVALLLFVGALVRAIAPGTGGPAALAAEPAPLQDEMAAAADRSLTMDALLLAVENDPFEAERRRPASRYRLPGNIEPPPPPPPPPLPDFRVAGTAVTPSGGFAIVHIGDAAPRVLEVGEYLAGFRLQHVAAESITMTNDEREVTLLVPDPAARAALPAPVQRGRGGQVQGRQGAFTRQDAQLLQALLQRARQQGATPQSLQQIQRLVEQEGVAAMAGMDIQIQNGNLVIRRRASPDTVPGARQPPDL